MLGRCCYLLLIVLMVVILRMMAVYSFFLSFLGGEGKGNFVGCFRSDGCVSVGDCFGCHGDEGGGGDVVIL